jgi:hypothetical protein
VLVNSVNTGVNVVCDVVQSKILVRFARQTYVPTGSDDAGPLLHYPGPRNTKPTDQETLCDSINGWPS